MVTVILSYNGCTKTIVINMPDAEPLSYRKWEGKEAQVREAVKLATQVQDRDQQLFALSGILVFADKVIDMDTANKIRRAIEMTQVARIFEEEKQQTVKMNAKQIVIRMIRKKYSTEESHP